MTNNSVQDIEHAITKLTSAQLDELYSRLADYQPQAMDERIATDLHAGLLDNAILRAVDDTNQGRTRPL